MLCKIYYSIALLLLSTLIAPSFGVINKPILIGVLSHRGYSETLKLWQLTADYLSDVIDGYQFEIVPLDFDSIQTAVEKKDVDFVLVNSGMYVNLETLFGISRLATMINHNDYGAFNLFGGVIFTRKNRSDIRHLSDLVNKRFSAVDEKSLGGFQMAWRELKRHNIDPYKDFSSLVFLGIHDSVVFSVLNNTTDAGTVRTGILERMAANNKINLNDFYILNEKQSNIPFQYSTDLYPEWPFSKLKHTSNQLAQKVAVALLQLPKEHEATKVGNYSGWTVPLQYQPVHKLFKELNLPPYYQQVFTLSDVFQRYWYWLLGGLFLVIGMVGIISLSMRYNKRLKQSKLFLRKRYDVILNSVADGIYGVDMEGKTTFVNRSMEKITGWQASDLIGQCQHQLLHHTRSDGSKYPSEECPVYKSARDGEARYIEDDIFWCKSGKAIHVAYSTTPIRSKEGNTLGGVVVFRDISQKRKLEDDMRDREGQLNHVSRLSTMGEMLSGIAHELNQPLTAINANARACVRMLESPKKDKIEDSIDAIEKIAFLSERAGEIIRHIRHFVSKEMPRKKATKIQQMITIVVELLQSEIRRYGINITYSIDDVETMVLVQDIQIEQVMVNLVRNSIEALSTNKEGHRCIAISVKNLHNNKVKISISDNGPGMAKEVLDNLFDPFITTKPIGQGMGLGLSISEGICRAHESQLKVESSKGIGTTFRFELEVVSK